jgi:D-alanyl-D-alanine carboxypeptidase
MPRARASVAFAVLLLVGGCSTTTPSVSDLPSAPSQPVASEPASPSARPSASPTVRPTPTPTGSPTTSPAPTATPAGAGIDGVVALVNDLISADSFSGAVLIGRQQDVVWTAAAGLADRTRGLANRTDTQFNVGSMNKMFTAVATLQLVEAGKLTLDDTIGDLLPDYPNATVAGSVTVDELLSHTSGLGDAFTPQFEADPHAYRTNADYLPLFVDQPLLFAPGSSWSYSNAGYVVLGLIIERVSGRTYDDYVRRHVFAPSGMGATAAYDVESTIPNQAIGYTTLDIEGNETGVLAANTALLPGRGFAAGGGYSTVEDLFRFGRALRSNQLLSAESTALLLAGKADMAPNVRYAYGFMDRLDAGQRVVGHTGGAPGVCSFMWLYLDSGYTAVVLSNSDSDCFPPLQYLRANPLR